MTPQPSEELFQVVVNHEEQYSIWADGRPVPEGWHPTGFAGTRRQCLDHIDEVWTDIRPLSVRRRIAQDRAQREAAR